MQLSIDTNVKLVEIVRNGKHVGDVAVPLSDPALLNRLRKVAHKAEEIQANSKLGELEDVDASLEEAERIDTEMRKLLDWAFASPVSAVVFGDGFCFSSSGGVTAMEQFLAGVIPMVEAEYRQEITAAEQRRGKYLDKYKK